MKKKNFECTNGTKLGQSYNIHKQGFDIEFNKNGEPLFVCRQCGTKYDTNSLKKISKQYGYKEV